MIAVSGTTLPIFSQKHLGQVPESNGADQAYYSEQVPAVPAEMQDAETIQQRGEGHQEKEGAGDVTMHAPTAERVQNTRSAHYGERDNPNDRSPTVADGWSPGHDNRNGRQPIQDENTPPA